MANQRGKPRKMESDKLLEFWSEYNNEIIENNYYEMPVQGRFCRWIKKCKNVDLSIRTIYNYVHECIGNDYLPTYKKEWQAILSETLAGGAAVGRYNSTMIIFCLKNWCGWTDAKQEYDITQKSEITSSSKLLKALLDDNTTRE